MYDEFRPKRMRSWRRCSWCGGCAAAARDWEFAKVGHDGSTATIGTWRGTQERLCVRRLVTGATMVNGTLLDYGYEEGAREDGVGQCG